MVGRITQDPRLDWVWFSSQLKFTPDCTEKAGVRGAETCKLSSFVRF